ncbi:MAG TPA: DUF3078 domain-containing protein [Prolixibacteraceae bacterium]|nr:DUF3078 domain-containing protein [Prolixibacteraceae bacterium]
MKRFLGGVLCFFVFTLSVSANFSEKRITGDEVKSRIDEIKKIVYSKEWVPADSVSFAYIKCLLDYAENVPVDSALDGLSSELVNRELFFVRDYQKIKNPEELKGYVPRREITQRCEEIEKEIMGQIPLNSIVVPEDSFAGSYPQQKLIGENELDRLVEELRVSDPDVFDQWLMLHAEQLADSLARSADSLQTAFLEEFRRNYNQQLIQSYRDSIAIGYQSKSLRSKISAAQQEYTDSVERINLKILAKHNDSETLRKNKLLKEDVRWLVDYISGIPYSLNVYNLKNEKSAFSLRSDENWYQWIWLKNEQNDSLGIRIESLDRHNVKMLVDESVNLSKLTFKDSREVGRIRPTKSNDLKLKKFTTRTPVLSSWKLVGKSYFGFTQNYINSFWAQGGQSSASALGTFNYVANYAKSKFKWENSADLKLGVVYYLPEEGATTQTNWHKNYDNLEVNSRLGYSAFKKWYYSAEANFKNQLFIGYKNVADTVPSSAFLSPAYLTFSAGLEYKPGKDFSALLSPVSLKTTYVTNPAVDETKFGLSEGETHKSRIGMSGKINYTKSVFENVNLKTQNSIFVNFGNNSDGEWQLLKLPDFDSETSIDFKVNQFITTQVNLHLVYDKDVESTWASASGAEMKGARLQVKEFFTLGFSYKF